MKCTDIYDYLSDKSDSYDRSELFELHDRPASTSIIIYKYNFKYHILSNTLTQTDRDYINEIRVCPKGKYSTVKVPCISQCFTCPSSGISTKCLRTENSQYRNTPIECDSTIRCLNGD